MPRTAYLVGTCGFSSILILAMVSLSPSSAESSSSAGAIMRQGPHHSAQKSTKTGFLESSTSAWKDASETLMGMAESWVEPTLYLGTRPLGVKARRKGRNLAVQQGFG